MSGMAEVLADHHSKSYNAELGTVFCLDPTCGWDGQANNFAVAGDVYAGHQADMLTAAGFGPVKEAKAEALEEAADSAESLDFTLIPAASLRARAAAVRGEA